MKLNIIVWWGFCRLYDGVDWLFCFSQAIPIFNEVPENLQTRCQVKGVKTKKPCIGGVLYLFQIKFSDCFLSYKVVVAVMSMISLQTFPSLVVEVLKMLMCSQASLFSIPEAISTFLVVMDENILIFWIICWYYSINWILSKKFWYYLINQIFLEKILISFDKSYFSVIYRRSTNLVKASLGSKTFTKARNWS